ncbi:alpha/beta fold hydrolase [Pseudomonas fluorescens]|uniref:alpha/beta fold hydrolase n=1 Tax=Pseudomonas fluorescens TaxID=294 RepID=UPI0012405185|nr:alpha/beta hydrolase [Pseudomonas fluorescens]VVM35527.1 2-succinyl-6-hydroxy-2, 4-cyclohexadiene-1-carboxylate synthase [Pseudomonas fluorescens]
MTVTISQKELWLPTSNGQVYIRTWVHDAKSRQHATPIVLFHDSLGCVELWRDFPAQLAASTGRDVIAYDRRGYGLSSPYPEDLTVDFIREEAQFFATLRDHLGIETFIAFGHSVGGAMAMNCAAMFPEQCLAVVSVSAQAFVEERTLLGIKNAKLQFGQPRQFERLEKYHGEKSQWVLNAWTQTWLSESFADWTIERGLGPIQCPLLVIHGVEDEYGSAAHPERIAKLTVKQSEILMLSDCHHVPHRETPEAVVAATQRFISSLRR